MKYSHALLILLIAGPTYSAESEIVNICKKQANCNECCTNYSTSYVEQIIKRCSPNPYNTQSGEAGFVLDQSRLDIDRFASEVENYNCKDFNEKRKRELRSIIYQCLNGCKSKNNGRK